LVALRQKDGAAFQVYRDSVSRVLRELTSRDAKKARQAFQDVVLPHLSDIDLALSNAKKVARRKIATNVAIGTGLVAVGLTTGLLPPNVGQIIASLGGLQAGANALQGMIELLAEPEAVRQNKYYFLWKARRHAAA